MGKHEKVDPASSTKTKITHTVKPIVQWHVEHAYHIVGIITLHVVSFGILGVLEKSGVLVLFATTSH